MENKITVKEIINITEAKMLQGNLNETCSIFSYDTRNLKPEETFIGIKTGDIDGSNFWEEAFKRGCKVAIIQPVELNEKILENWKDKTILIVEDTILAAQKIAKYKREKYGKNLKVVAITGSVGKTSTKDMVANVISQQFNTLKTIGNYNNHIGLPFTLLHLTNEEVAVVEMGMNHFGEISLLTNIAKPDIAIITNIGTSHIGNLGSRENILKAKLEILEGMNKKEIIINNDNDLLHNWSLKNKKDSKLYIHTFGMENESEVWAEDVNLQENSSTFLCHIGQEKIQITVPVGGIHFVYNALCAALVGKILGIEIEKIKKGIENFELTKKRMELIKKENDITIINDAYNASLESIKAAIQYLEGYKGHRKIAVLGDIFELGDYAEKIHRQVGQVVANSDIDILVCSGENSKYIVEEAKGKETYYFKTREEIKKYLEEQTKPHDVILIKASNGMKFYELCN